MTATQAARSPTSRSTYGSVLPLPDPATARRIERLLWRAGFGPRPDDVARYAAKGVKATVHELVHPAGRPHLVGSSPVLSGGRRLRPDHVKGHDHLAWLDRMVRTDQPLVERMALIWHDWFACSGEKVNSLPKMRAQIALFRTKGLGRFIDLAVAVTRDPAMLVFLDGKSNHAGDTNENYARECMELFTLGADRGAYTEEDVRQMARALTGWTSDRVKGQDVNFRWVSSLHDYGTKTIFGAKGDYNWDQAVKLCVLHPLHASFFVTKLWSYFAPTPPNPATLRRLMGIYTGSGTAIRPVVEAILSHRDVLDGPPMVKPPVVEIAGLLRGMRRKIDTDLYVRYAPDSGQRLFYPPNVAGWDDQHWLDTSTLHGRWLLARAALAPRSFFANASEYPDDETPFEAVTAALQALNNPRIDASTFGYLVEWARTCMPPRRTVAQRSAFRAQRQNALRQLIASSPDFHLC